MLSKYTIEALAESLPDQQKVRAFKKKGAGNSTRFLGPTPVDRMKHPWVVEVNGICLDDERQREFRFASEAAALLAGQKYIKVLIDATFGYYWEIVHTKTDTVVNSGFTVGFGCDRAGARPYEKIKGYEIRTMAVYSSPTLGAKHG